MKQRKERQRRNSMEPLLEEETVKKVNVKYDKLEKVSRWVQIKQTFSPYKHCLPALVLFWLDCDCDFIAAGKKHAVFFKYIYIFFNSFHLLRIENVLGKLPVNSNVKYRICYVYTFFLDAQMFNHMHGTFLYILFYNHIFICQHYPNVNMMISLLISQILVQENETDW